MPANESPTLRIFRVILIIVASLCLLQIEVNPTTAAVRSAKVDLTPALAIGDQYHVKVQFELDGELKLKAEGSHPAKSPVQVNAQLVYDEKTAASRCTKSPGFQRSTALRIGPGHD